MADIKKGIVTQVAGDKAIVRPYGSGAALTPALPVQKINMGGTVYLHPVLIVGDSVAFALFDDGTGIIIDKL